MATGEEGEASAGQGMGDRMWRKKVKRRADIVRDHRTSERGERERRGKGRYTSRRSNGYRARSFRRESQSADREGEVLHERERVRCAARLGWKGR
jgi:hypothetical protein